MSLKSKIHFFLEKNGYLSLQDLELLCKQEQKKLSNGERRLRELMKAGFASPKKNPAGAIIGYYYAVVMVKPLIDVVAWNSQFIKPVEEKINQNYLF